MGPDFSFFDFPFFIFEPCPFFSIGVSECARMNMNGPTLWRRVRKKGKIFPIIFLGPRSDQVNSELDQEEAQGGIVQ